MEKVDIRTGNVVITPATFGSNTETNLLATDVNELYDVMRVRVSENMAMFQRQGSNCRFKSIIALEIHIRLPKVFVSKKAIINVKTNDDRYFLSCV